MRRSVKSCKEAMDLVAAAATDIRRGYDYLNLVLPGQSVELEANGLGFSSINGVPIVCRLVLNGARFDIEYEHQGRFRKIRLMVDGENNLYEWGWRKWPYTIGRIALKIAHSKAADAERERINNLRSSAPRQVKIYAQKDSTWAVRMDGLDEETLKLVLESLRSFAVSA